MRYNTYSERGSWEIVIHPIVRQWLDSLRRSDYKKVFTALEALEEQGPNLGRPFADQVKNSRFKNMKELRPRGKKLRLLFAFDPNRKAIILVAGDKTNNWIRWYEQNIPIADQRFSEHLKNYK
jgi:hypothetical protein